MANMMEKVGEKLHMGGHRKDEPQHEVVAPGYGTSAVDPIHHNAAAGTDPVATPAAAQHQGPMEKVKNMVKGGKDKAKAKVHGGDESSSSSSESDGEGGRRKKLGVF